MTTWATQPIHFGAAAASATAPTWLAQTVHFGAAA